MPRPAPPLTMCGSWMLARLWIRDWLRLASSCSRDSFCCSIALFSSSIVFKLVSMVVIYNAQVCAHVARGARRTRARRGARPPGAANTEPLRFDPRRQSSGPAPSGVRLSCLGFVTLGTLVTGESRPLSETRRRDKGASESSARRGAAAPHGGCGALGRVPAWQRPAGLRRVLRLSQPESIADTDKSHSGDLLRADHPVCSTGACDAARM